MVFVNNKSKTKLYISYYGRQFWYKNNKYHRTDGPARIWEDGSEEWWENDERIK